MVAEDAELRPACRIRMFGCDEMDSRAAVGYWLCCVVPDLPLKLEREVREAAECCGWARHCFLMVCFIEALSKRIRCGKNAKYSEPRVPKFARKLSGK